MSATRNPAGNAADPDDSRDNEIKPTPDEDGPHDVPDDTVIEKTLPTTPVDGGGRAS
jgi:hypothetical protein